MGLHPPRARRAVCRQPRRQRRGECIGRALRRRHGRRRSRTPCGGGRLGRAAGSKPAGVCGFAGRKGVDTARACSHVLSPGYVGKE
eukprot:179310-Chlamydomonas_euryale.AAC.1